MRLSTIIMSLLCYGAACAAPLNNIIVFGDSLSDNGNLYEYMQHRLPLSPPYFNGRFSNGPIWVERVANAFFPENGASHLLDYAFGGAGVTEDGSEEEEALFTLKHEIDAYLLAHRDKASPDSLFIVWIGANNYLAIPEGVEETVFSVNRGIVQGLERLTQKGARHILVMNLPDLGKIPVAKDYEAETQLSLLSKKHNDKLADSFQVLQKKYPEVQWLYFDVDQSFKQMLSKPELFGFTNVNDTCYAAVVDKPSQLSLLKMASRIDKHTLNNEACEGFLFFDPVHSTALAHQVIADQVRKMLDTAGVIFER